MYESEADLVTSTAFFAGPGPTVDNFSTQKNREVVTVSICTNYLLLVRIHTDLPIRYTRERVASQTVEAIDFKTIAVTRHPPTNACFALAAIKARKYPKCAIEYWGRQHFFQEHSRFPHISSAFC